MVLPEPSQAERDYSEALAAHLPHGEAWSRSVDSNFGKLLLGMAGELARMAARALDLERETDPRTSTELISEWEEFLGLPDPCAGQSPDLLVRRAAVVAKLLDGGGSTPGYLIALAARLGYTITIREHKPFRMGIGRMGDPLDGPGNPFLMGVGRMGDRLGTKNVWEGVFEVLAPEFTEHWFRMGSTMGTRLRTVGNEILECAIRRAQPAHLLGLFTYSEPTTDAVEMAYAPFHLGHTSPAFGLFTIDNATKRFGLRQTAPSGGIPAAIWIYGEVLGTQGSGAFSFRVRLARSLTADPWQPDLSGDSLEWVPANPSAPGWIRIPLDSAPALMAPILEGEVIHVTIERQSGTLSGAKCLRLITAKSRQPLQYTYRADEDGVAVRDDLLSILYTADLTDPSGTPYTAQRGDNSSLDPIWFLEMSAGQPFGNPFDVLEEVQVYGDESGPASLAVSVRIPSRLTDWNYWSLSMRGDGLSSALGGPQDDLYLSVRDEENAVVLPTTPIVDKDGRLFQGRPHPFGYNLPLPRTLRRGARYLFVLTSPLSEGPSGGHAFSANDSYLVTLVSSTLDPSIFTGQNGVDSYVQVGGTTLSPRRQAGLLLQSRDATPVGYIDEFNNRITAPPGNVTSVTVNAAHDGDTVTFTGITRNTGVLSDGTNTGELWARLIDIDTGDAPPGYSGDLILTGPLGLVPTLAHNDETTVTQWSFDVVMGSAPMRLRIETGHALVPGDLTITGSGPSSRLSGGLVLDDYSPFELELQV